MKTIGVVTTINEPTKAVKELASRIPVIVVGDEKTPKEWQCKGVKYYSDIQGLSCVPKNHYAVKNAGYLLAMQQGAECIYDTDDDNIPNENWKIRGGDIRTTDVIRQGWCNVYCHFTDVMVWPRGFPLSDINTIRSTFLSGEKIRRHSPVQQGMANGSPDVDAIWRLLHGQQINFDKSESLSLTKKTWCPFNSQSTWWFKQAFPLMYLPIHASFRMTDIWRSFVAQRCLWEMGYGVVFHSPAEVFQERNPHDLMKDFQDEISGYLNNHKIAEALDKLELKGDIFDNIFSCYEEFVRMKLLPIDEMVSLSNWIEEIKKVWNH